MRKFKTNQHCVSLLFGLIVLLIAACGGETSSAVANLEEKAKDLKDAATEAVDAAVTEVEMKIHELERSEDFIDFAHFGHFDFALWEKGAEKIESAGDANSKSTSYTLGNMVLEISETDKGEYGYSHSHILKTAEGQIIKERTFSFETDPEMSFAERIHDHEAGKVWTRKQKADKRYTAAGEQPEFDSWEFNEEDVAKG